MNLLLSYAPSPGTRRELNFKNASCCTIGWRPDCDLILNHEKVSCNHARLNCRRPDQWLLDDLNSTNGTFLDDVRVAGSVLLQKPSNIKLKSLGLILRVQPNHENGYQGDMATNGDVHARVLNQINLFADPTQPGLNDEQQYCKSIGDMARVQASIMIKKDQARNFPTIVFGLQWQKKCDDTPNSFGAYNPKCQLDRILKL